MSSSVAPTFLAIHKWIESQMTKLAVPSLTVGVQQHGKIVYEAAFGYSNVEQQRLTTLDTPYSIASITKPMIATLLAKFVEQGFISWDAPVNRYLTRSKVKSWVGSSEEITIARLANHTAGLPLYFQFFFEDEGERPPSTDITVSRYGNSVRTPGAAYTYSNIGYGILGFVLEEVAQRPLRDIIQTELFEPLEMTQSSFGLMWSDPKEYATRYDCELKQVPHYITDHPAASEAYSSVYDLLKFGSSFLGEFDSPVLTRASMNRMCQPLPESPNVRYGLGWALSQSLSGIPMFGHSGGMDGVSTRLLILPSHNAVISVLANRETPLVLEVLDQLCGVFDMTINRNVIVQTNESGIQEGAWIGVIVTPDREVSVGLIIREVGEPSFTVEGEPKETKAEFTNGQLTGSIQASISTPDTDRAPHTLLFDMSDNAGQWIGAVTARLDGGSRIGHAISFPVILSPHLPS